MTISTASIWSIAQLYVALFGRAPDTEGLWFWGGRCDSGESLESLANAMFATEPARRYYPDDATDQEIVASFYLNVLGRTADSEGLRFWTQKLESAPTPGSVISEMISVVSSYGGTDESGLASHYLFRDRVSLASYCARNYGEVGSAEMVVSPSFPTWSTWAVRQAIDQLASNDTSLVLAGVGRVDLAGHLIESLLVDDQDGGPLQLINASLATAGNLVSVSGRLDELSIHSGDFTDSGGADEITLRLLGVSDPFTEVNDETLIGTLILEQIDNLHIQMGSVTAGAEIHGLVAPDLERLVISGEKSSSYNAIYVHFDEAGSLTHVDASGAGQRVHLSGVVSQQYLHILDGPYDDFFLVNGGLVELGPGDDWISFYRPTGLEGVLTVRFDSLAEEHISVHENPSGTEIVMHLPGEFLSDLKLKGASLTTATSAVDLFEGWSVNGFAQGSNIAAYVNGTAGYKLVIDLNGDGWGEHSITLGLTGPGEALWRFDPVDGTLLFSFV